MFHGAKPAGQPRTVRTLAEKNADARNFPTDLPYNTQAGAPLSMVGAGSSYKDPVEGSGVTARAEQKAPFTITRKGSK